MTIDWLKDRTTGLPFYPVTHEDAVIDSNGVSLSTKLNLKQDKLRVTIGSMYRTNVGGSGSLSISGTTGLFPNISTAGTYTVITLAESATSNYTINITFGSNSYTLTSNNGIIDDSRLLTLATNDRWNGSISTVATNTKVGVYIVDDYIEGINIVGVTGNYSDLSNKPDLSLKENISNKVTSISSSSTNTLYPSALAVYNALQAIDTGSDSGTCPDLSLGTTSGAGNAVTDISVSGHLITMTKGSTFLPTSGGTFTGPVKWSSSTALPESTSMLYILGIDAFASGGTTKWSNVSNLSVGKAIKDGSGNTITSTYATKTEANAKYTKPSTGIPSTDLASDVQTNLTLASTALQSETSLSKGTTTGSGNAVTDITVSGHTITLNKGASFATLDSNGLVSANQLPSYVDDVIDGYKYGSDFYRPLVDGELKMDATSSDFTNDTKVTPVKNKIYFWVGDGHCYRWSGTEYVLIVASPGTTSNVPEGSNLYFTDARALAAVATLLSGKADKVVPSAANNVALLNASGNLVDSGKTLGKSVPSNAVFTDVACNEQYHYTPSTADNSSNISLVPGGVLKIITAINLDSRKHVVSVTSGDLTKNMVGLSSVTNDRQVKGLSSGTTSGHIVTFGSDGYTITDSGVSVSDLGSNVLYIDVSDENATVPSGTYANITNALASGTHVVLRVTMDTLDSQIMYAPICLDYTDTDNIYYFTTTYLRTCFVFTINSQNAFTSSEYGSAALSHTHGNITNEGALLTTDITIANGDKLVVTDSSNSNKVARTSISFDGSTTTLALSKKGTWESFENTSNKVSSISSNSTSTLYPSALAVYNAIQDAVGTSDAGEGLPSVSSSDNNKILLVVNGTWTLVTPPAIYSGSTTPSSSLGNNGDIYIQTS